MISQIPKLAYLETVDQLALIIEGEEHCIEFYDCKFDTKKQIKPQVPNIPKSDYKDLLLSQQLHSSKETARGLDKSSIIFAQIGENESKLHKLQITD